MYTVIEYIPGHDPETDALHFESLVTAQAVASFRATVYRKEGRYDVTGNALDGYEIVDLSKPHNIATHIAILKNPDTPLRCPNCAADLWTTPVKRCATVSTEETYVVKSTVTGPRFLCPETANENTVEVDWYCSCGEPLWELFHRAQLPYL